MIVNIYDNIIGRMCVYQTREDGFIVSGRIEKAEDTSPTSFYLIDKSGTRIGVELEQVLVLDNNYSPLLNGKEYIDRVM